MNGLINNVFKKFRNEYERSSLLSIFRTIVIFLQVYYNKRSIPEIFSYFNHFGY